MATKVLLGHPVVLGGKCPDVTIMSANVNILRIFTPRAGGQAGYRLLAAVSENP